MLPHHGGEGKTRAGAGCASLSARTGHVRPLVPQAMFAARNGYRRIANQNALTEGMTVYRITEAQGDETRAVSARLFVVDATGPQGQEKGSD